MSKNNVGGGGRGQVNTCPRQRLSYSYDMCTTLGQCELNTVTYQVFGSRSSKKYTKFRLLTAACWVLYAIFLGEKKAVIMKCLINEQQCPQITSRILDPIKHVLKF